MTSDKVETKYSTFAIFFFFFFRKAMRGISRVSAEDERDNFASCSLLSNAFKTARSAYNYLGKVFTIGKRFEYIDAGIYVNKRFVKSAAYLYLRRYCNCTALWDLLYTLNPFKNRLRRELKLLDSREH